MYKNYSLDPNAARKADEKGGRIEETGAFSGRIKYAIATKSTGGAEGVEIHFESDDRREARVTVWTYKKNGDVNDSGMNLLNAIMTCVMVKGLSATESMAELYDANAGGRVQKRVTLYPELQKPIGFVFQLAPEEYKKDGDLRVANRVEIYGVFNAQTHLTSSEILTKATEPKKRQLMLDTVKDKAIKKYVPKAGGGAASSQGAPAHADDFEDAIPF